MLLELNAAKRHRAISLTPLIDVVFILLLFFMLSSSFIHWQQLDIYQASGSGSRSDTELIRVDIENTHGDFSAAGEYFSLDSPSRISRWVTRHSADTHYAIRADDKFPTQALINVLDSLKQAGADKVALAEAAP